MNDSQLKSFVAVAESGSFSKAADHSFLTKQALIKQLDALEQELGFQLLLRSSRGVKLTQAGESFYTGAKELLHLEQTLVERSRALANHCSTIRIANPPHQQLLLADAMSEYARRWPEVHQEVVFLNGSQIIEGILSGSIDVGEHVLTDDIRRDDLDYTPISSGTYYCVVTSGHPLAGRDEIHLEDLSGSTVGVMRENQRELTAVLERHCSHVVLREQSSDEVHTAAIYNLCFSGGVYITKRYYAATLRPLVAIPLADLRRESVLVYRRAPAPEIRNFVALVQELAGTRDPEHQSDQNHNR